jgi:ankyrin repeat protein
VKRTVCLILFFVSTGLFPAGAHIDSTVVVHESSVPMEELERLLGRLNIEVAMLEGDEIFNKDEMFRAMGESPDWVSILLNAIDEGILSKVQYVVKNFKVSLDATDSYGNTPMAWAAIHNNASIISYFIEEGGNINSLSRKEKTLWELAYERGLSKNMELLLFKGIQLPNSVLKENDFQEKKNSLMNKLERQAVESRNPILMKKAKRLLLLNKKF